MPETRTPQFLSPERVVSYLDVKPGNVVADFGSGSGYYTIPLALKVGAEGKVYAFDVLPQAVEFVRGKAEMLHLLQVEVLRADLESPHGTHLKDNVVDLVVVASILHQADDKMAVLREAHRILKPGRNLAFIEWDQAAEGAFGGPPASLRIPKANAKELVASAGFTLDREFEAGSHHYGLLFRKQ